MTTFLIGLGFVLLACMIVLLFNQNTDLRIRLNIIENKIDNLAKKSNNIKY